VQTWRVVCWFGSRSTGGVGSRPRALTTFAPWTRHAPWRYNDRSMSRRRSVPLEAALLTVLTRDRWGLQMPRAKKTGHPLAHRCAGGLSRPDADAQGRTDLRRGSARGPVFSSSATARHRARTPSSPKHPTIGYSRGRGAAEEDASSWLSCGRRPPARCMPDLALDRHSRRKTCRR